MRTMWDAAHARNWRTRAAGAVIVGVSLTVAACSGTGVTSPTATSAAAATDRGVVLDSMKPVTVNPDAPTEPFKPAAHKHIMIMTCGNAGAGCVRIAQGAKEAAEAIGWTADVVDGRFDPTVQNAAVLQAVHAGVDGIISVAADPNLMSQAMALVAAKKVPFVVASQTPSAHDVPGVDSWVSPDPVQSGKNAAEWVQKDSAGKAKILIVDLPGFADIGTRNGTLVAGLRSDCAQCVIYRVNGSAQTMGTSLAPQVTSQLQQHPDTTYVWSPDDALSDFIAQGIRQAGKTSSVKLVSRSGSPEELTRIKEGTAAADGAAPDNYGGWLAFDSLARAISGVTVKNYVIEPERWFSAANIDGAPSDMLVKGWNVDFDYRAAFKTMWGVQ